MFPKKINGLHFWRFISTFFFSFHRNQVDSKRVNFVSVILLINHFQTAPLVLRPFKFQEKFLMQFHHLSHEASGGFFL